ncbi:MAG: hypothetical protein WBO34_15035, partial [Gammaproteobacteria bacterium]
VPVLAIGALTVALGLAGCAPAPVGSGPHRVAVEMKPAAVTVSLETARIRAVDGNELVRDILAQVTATDSGITLVPGADFMDAAFPGESTATLAGLADRAGRVAEQPLTHLVLLDVRTTGSKTHGEVSAVATLISTAQLAAPETLSFDAEGYRRGLSLPLPYIFLFFFYSDPDVEGSATARIAAAIVEKMQADERRPLVLTLLTSDNLMALIESADPDRAQAPEQATRGDPMDDMKHPLGLYSTIMSDAREEGEWAYYNPITHVIMLMSSVMTAPMAVAIDAVFDEDASHPGARTPNRREPTQFEAALAAIKREDWVAGYRLLEDYVVNADVTLQSKALQLFRDYPELLAAAPQTFSTASLQASRRTYGDQAFALEQGRLALYEHVASPEDYARAEENLREVFAEQCGDGRGVR